MIIPRCIWNPARSDLCLTLGFNLRSKPSLTIRQKWTTKSKQGTRESDSKRRIKGRMGRSCEDGQGKLQYASNSTDPGPDLLRLTEERNGMIPNLHRSPKETSARRYLQKRVQLHVFGEIVFGLHPVLIALEQNHRDVHKLFLKKDIDKESSAVSKILTIADERNLDIEECEGAALDALCNKKARNQGVCLDASERKYKFVPEDGYHDLFTPSSQRMELFLYLDEVQDPMNFGAILRSAYFFGVKKVFAPSYNSCRLSPIVSKASAGAMEVMDIHSVENTEKLLQVAKSCGLTVLGTASSATDQNQKQPISVDEVNQDRSTLLLLGNEGKGLRLSLHHLCDAILTIRPPGDVHHMIESLNVSVATGILLHGLSKARKESRM